MLNSSSTRAAAGRLPGMVAENLDVDLHYVTLNTSLKGWQGCRVLDLANKGQVREACTGTLR